MRRRLSALAVFAALLLPAALGPAGACAAGWHSEQPISAGGTVPTALGKISDIEFWAPDRGVLITAKGLWAYDGTGWHELADVCGGTDGRIAWAGPLDFWTISDQAGGQANVAAAELQQRSLCHFVDGAVVASYAEPIGSSASYQPMDAAACLGPSDCWFGGARLPGRVNHGAFHLHWDGRQLTTVPSLAHFEPSLVDPERAVADLEPFAGTIYESVVVGPEPIAGESPAEPFLLHEIAAGEPPGFLPVFPQTPIEYGGAAPSALEALHLSSDGNALWAAAASPAGEVPTTILRLGPEGLVPLRLSDPEGLLSGAGEITDIAAEPGSESAWVGFWPASERGARPFPARLARVQADGTVDDGVTLPLPEDGIARKQQADRIICPAPGQCWMSTQTGWLFHLGGNLPRDEAPAMHQLITYRPPDASTTVLPLDTLPEEALGGASGSEEAEPFPRRRHRPHKARDLVSHSHQKIVDGTILELRFTLIARARVQLIAKYKQKTVAATKARVLAKGKHVLRLRLDPKRWPTKLDLRAKPANSNGKSGR